MSVLWYRNLSPEAVQGWLGLLGQKESCSNYGRTFTLKGRIWPIMGDVSEQPGHARRYGQSCGVVRSGNPAASYMHSPSFVVPPRDSGHCCSHSTPKKAAWFSGWDRSFVVSHENLLSIARSNTSVAGQWQNRDLRVKVGGCLGECLSAQNVVYET